MSTHVSDIRRVLERHEDPDDPWSATWDKPLILADHYGRGIFYIYRDGTGRPWIEQYVRQEEGGYDLYYLTSDNFANPGGGGVPGLDPLPIQGYGDGYYDPNWFRHAHEGEVPVGRVESHVEESPPLEESTPLFGPQEAPALEPDYEPWDQPREGHWDPRSLQWVPDDPTSSVGKVLDDDTPWDQPREEQPTMRSAGILDDDSEGTQVPVDEGGGAGGSAQGEGGDPILDPRLEQGKGGDPDLEDPPSPTGPWDQPREGQPTTRRSAGILDDNSEDTQVPVEGGAAGGVDPSVPFDPDTTPTSVEGTAAAPFNVDSTSFEGSTARGFDPSVPLDWANPNLQSLDRSLFDLNAPGPTLDPGLFDEAEPGPTLDPSLFDSNAPGPTLDPGLFDLNSPGPTVDPALFDERAPGPTLDPGLLDSAAPGPTLDPNRLGPSAPGDTLDEAQLERASERPSSVGEPADVTGRGDTDPRPMEEPADPEPSTPRHGDHDDPLDVG